MRTSLRLLALLMLTDPIGYQSLLAGLPTPNGCGDPNLPAADPGARKKNTNATERLIAVHMIITGGNREKEGCAASHKHTRFQLIQTRLRACCGVGSARRVGFPCRAGTMSPDAPGYWMLTRL
ncbi:MAG: hypothetical protein DRI65_08865 [Chloroflexota bacterium]|nr:MAG: hypothetical protein DRI65_08865 [Chloroflexota bacterium]